MSLNPSSTQRLSSIDAVRGFIIILMLVDHVRETFYLHHQLTDPVDITQTEPELFWSRAIAHLCAPLFVFLTGISAFLFQQKVKNIQLTRNFLIKRGLFLIVLELTLVNFAWTAQFPPQIIYLQVIWAIGISMLMLAVFIGTKPWLQALVAILLIGTHNLFDSLSFTQPVLQNLWYILHQRGWIEFGDILKVRTSYPILPWIGIILLGYISGHLFKKNVISSKRQLYLVNTGLLAISLFLLLRFLNGYGDFPWHSGADIQHSVMSFFNLTKYPPSLLFILWNLGVGLILLAVFEKYAHIKCMQPLIVYGSAPMFFYLLHLYVLKLLYLICIEIFGYNYGQYFGVSSVWLVWGIAILLAIILFPIVHKFAVFKHSHPQIKFLKYF